MEENVKNVSEKQENLRLNSANSKKKNNEFVNMRLVKNYKTFYEIKKKLFFFCIYKMYLISAEGYKKASVHFLRVRKTGEIWSSMKDVHRGLGVKNMSDLILKEIYGIYETKNLTNKQNQKYKMTEREIFEKYANLSKDEFNTKTNKKIDDSGI